MSSELKLYSKKNKIVKKILNKSIHKNNKKRKKKMFNDLKLSFKIKQIPTRILIKKYKKN